MPLSEHEQRLFEQIERSLSEDPKFASAVRHSDPKFHARRRMIFAGFMMVVGLALLVYGTFRYTWLGLAGFVVMLSAAGFAIMSHRRSQRPELKVVGGSTQGRAKRGFGIIDRLERRWQERGGGGY